MIHKFFDIIKRAHYFFAILLTVGGLCGASYFLYEQYKEPKLQSWAFVTKPNTLPGDHVYYNDLPWAQYQFDKLSNRVLESLATKSGKVFYVELKSNFEKVIIEIDSNFATMPKVNQDKDINEIAEVIWPKKHHDWVSMILLILLPLPIAGILHIIVRWIFWGKLL